MAFTQVNKYTNKTTTVHAECPTEEGFNCPRSTKNTFYTT